MGEPQLVEQTGTAGERPERGVPGVEVAEAVAYLCDGDAPVDDWDVMEREIEARWETCWD